MSTKKEERLLAKIFDLSEIDFTDRGKGSDEAEYFYQKLVGWDDVLGWLEGQVNGDNSIVVSDSEALDCLSVDIDDFNEAVTMMKAFDVLEDGPKTDGRVSFVLNPEASQRFQFFLDGFLFHRDLLSEASPA